MRLARFSSLYCISSISGVHAKEEKEKERADAGEGMMMLHLPNDARDFFLSHVVDNIGSGQTARRLVHAHVQ